MYMVALRRGRLEHCNFAIHFVNYVIYLFIVLQIERTLESQDMAPVFTDLSGKHLHGKKDLPSKAKRRRQPKKSE